MVLLYTGFCWGLWVKFDNFGFVLGESCQIVVRLLWVVSVGNSPDSSGMNAQALATKNKAAFIRTDSGTFLLR